MKRRFLAALLGISLASAMGARVVQADNSGSKGKIKYVLLISIDGLHALDVANYIVAHPHSALAKLSKHGITYSNVRTPANSDSFPGLLALITGGSPNSHGLFYDVSYNRSVYDPTNTSCQGQAGNMQVYDESIDQYDVQNVSKNVIDPSKLPRYINDDGSCAAKYPHNAVRVNTIFEVAKDANLHTAWADKHPAYDLVNGPSGKGVDDLYTPELTNVGGFDNTISVVCTADNDWLKVRAILNEIHGLTHDGRDAGGVPAIFGMNFQAVSVGQKIEKDNDSLTWGTPACPTDTDPHINLQPGGYLDGAGTPTRVLDYGFKKTDDALWAMINALTEVGIYDSTLFIVTAKHGQTPINPLKTNKPGHFADIVYALDNNNQYGIIINNAGNNCPKGPCGFVQDDDIALIWLPDQTQTTGVAAYLNANADKLFIDEVLSGKELKLKFNNPLNDPATPDIIVQPAYGTIYTSSQKKNAEHGGFSYADTNVGLIVSNPDLDPLVVKSPVASSQVAPTILKALGLDPDALDAVRQEGTQVLPFLFGEGGQLNQ